MKWSCRFLTPHTIHSFLHSKHVFVPNFCNMDCGYTEITPENKHLIESCYEARTEKELPVLVQYIDRNKFEAPKATHLDIILYSREQIIKENEAMGNEVCICANQTQTHTSYLVTQVTSLFACIFG